MKIGVYDPYLDTLGGGEKYMITLAECLSKEHEVYIFWDRKEDLARVAERFAIDASAMNTYPNIFSSRYSRIPRFLESRKFDAIFYLSDGSVPVVSCKLFMHYQFPVEWVQAGIASKLKLSRVNTIFCNSKFTGRYIDKKLNVKSRVIYPPVDMHEISSNAKENIILHVGRFMGNEVEGDDYKKQQAMTEVFKEMVDSGLKKWKFVIAASIGKDQEKSFSDFRSSVKKYPIEFVLNSDNKDLWSMYQKAKIYWHASGYGENLEEYPERAEHFGISTVEAMHAGAVPVVINAGGQPEIVQDNKNGMLWESLEELKEKTLGLIQNEKLLSSLSREAQRTSSKFSKDSFCKNISDLIS